MESPCARQGSRATWSILYGDCPLIPKESVRALINALDADGRRSPCSRSHAARPAGYGRILRDAEGRVRAIREQRDCSPEARRAVREVNPGLYAVRRGLPAGRHRAAQRRQRAGRALPHRRGRAGREAAGGRPLVAWDMADLRGVNDRYELALCAEERRLRIALALARTVSPCATCARLRRRRLRGRSAGAVLEAQVHLRGRCVVETGAFASTWAPC
jgi:bifunctional UDP-N-acetylglucosamine pyrophosphorylase/glucosamine-1-phosphate N-acetyltransferase